MDKYIELKGGINTQTPQIAVDAGEARFLFNMYESVEGGYTTLKGYEGLDGGVLPSESVWYVLRGTRTAGNAVDDATNLTPFVPLNDGTQLYGEVTKINGANPTIEPLIGDILHVDYDGAGVVDPDAVTFIVMNPSSLPIVPFKLTNDYAAGPTNEYTITHMALAGPPAHPYETYTEAGMDALTLSTRRADTREPKGLGAVTGVVQVGSRTVAMRNSTANDAGAATFSMADPSNLTKNWDQARVGIPVLLDEAAADASIAPILGTSAAQCLGNWTIQDTRDEPNSAGFIYAILIPTATYLPQPSPANGFELISASSGANFGAVSLAALFSWTPAAGGELDSFEHNFYAGVDTNRAYMTDGVNPAMYFDPETLAVVPIATSYYTQVGGPTLAGHCAAFQSRLILSTLGGGFITTVAGDPMVVDGTLGSIEIGVGDTITGFANASANELIIFTLNSTWSMSGSDPSNWTLRQVSGSSGAKKNCVVDMGDLLAADDVGIVDVQRSDKLGGFNSSTVSNNIQRFYRELPKTKTCSTVIQGLEQFRMFFDGSFVIGTKIQFQTANGNAGIRYGYSIGAYPIPVTTVNTRIRDNGDEFTVFGSTTGKVYRMDSGTSFDGANITSLLHTTYNHVGTPQNNKRFEYANLETVSVGINNVSFEQSINYGEKTFDTRSFVIDGIQPHPTGYVGVDSNLTHNNLRLRGTGRNIRLLFTRTSDTEQQLAFTGYTLRYTVRGLVRN